MARSTRSRSTSNRSAPETAKAKSDESKKGNESQDEPLHPTVAVSDAFMAATAWFSAWRISRVGLNQYVQLGFICFGLACSTGVLRFGFNPEIFRKYNEILAKNAGRVGVPLLAFATAFTDNAEWEVQAPMLLFLLCVVSLCSTLWSSKVQELYTIAIGVVGNFFLIKHGVQKSISSIVVGSALFVLGGLAIGSDRNRYICGVRRENLFHYCLGTALLFIGEHVAIEGTWKLSSFFPFM